MHPGTRKLWHFHGGLHLPANKSASLATPLTDAPLPARIVLPLHQHIGAPAEPVVEVGQRVLKGQMVAHASEYVSAPVHASTSGTVVAIGDFPVPHPSNLSAPCIVIEADGRDEAVPAAEPLDHLRLDPSALRNLIREAGIVGLGGAAFPTYIKLNPGPGRVTDSLVINAAECEPYITCDDMLMRSAPRDIIEGIKIMRHALQARHVVVGIEDNKPEALRAMREALASFEAEQIELAPVPTLYPAGGERQLIKVLTGKEVPSQGLPLDINVVCHNVGTAVAVYRALQFGEPLIERIVTVTGPGIARPANLRARIGTPIAELVAACGGYTDQAKRLIMGGPMMGFALNSDELPVTKATNCILVDALDARADTQAEMPCIRCAACAATCPANLLPQQLYWYAKARDFDKVQDYNLFDCIECGCCALVCPSHIPLVQYYRFAKTEIWAAEREKQKADVARRRHEFRLHRIERDKAERAERLAKKKAALDSDKPSAVDPKKAAIEAALARVRKKQEAGEHTPRNVDNLTPEQQAKIAEVDARRRATNDKPTTAEPPHE